MIEELMRITKRDFCFSEQDLKCMRETFMSCDMLIRDGCVAAIQNFENVTYLYFFAVLKKNAGYGKKLILDLVDEYEADIFSAVTCHLAVTMIFERIIREKGYSRSVDHDVVKKIISRLEEDEGGIEYDIKDKNIVLRNFYGYDIP